MSNSKVHQDAQGIFVRTNGAVYRPGPITGWSHAYDMSDGGLKAGDLVKAYAVSQTPTCRVKLPNGREVRWGNQYLHDLERRFTPPSGGAGPNLPAATGLKATPLKKI